jgi:hypothetical protein
VKRFLLLAAVGAALCGCNPEESGPSAPKPSVNDFQREQAAADSGIKQSVEFKPGIYEGSATVTGGTIKVSAAFREDHEATITRVFAGAEGKTEVVKGKWSVEGTALNVAVTEINGQVRSRTEPFLIEGSDLQSLEVWGDKTVTKTEMVLLKKVKTEAGQT